MGLQLFLGAVLISLAVSVMGGWFIGKRIAPRSIGLLGLLFGFVSFYVLGYLFCNSAADLVAYGSGFAYINVNYDNAWTHPLIMTSLYLFGLAALCGMTRGPSLPDYYGP